MTPNQRKHDSHELEGVKNRRSKAAAFPWLRAGFFVLACGLTVFLLSPLPREIWRKISEQEVEPAPSPQEQIAAKDKEEDEKQPHSASEDHPASPDPDTRKLAGGGSLTSSLTLLKGKAASIERKSEESYTVHYDIRVHMPEPIKSVDDFKTLHPNVISVLPGLEKMLPSAEVSSFFYQLYKNKTKRLKEKSGKFNELMTRHNFFDCETILNLKYPSTGRRVLLVQAEMDVVSDGSDGDRLPEMPDRVVNSSHYQPMTSYGWKKTGTTPNPLIAGWKRRIAKADAEIALSSTKKARKDWLKSRIKKIKREIADMESRSFLVADYDPFIVMPINMLLDKRDKYAARVGDYAVVIYEDKIYPAIVGDAGPSFKIGEASLRLSKAINPQASSYSRPVSDLKVTYVVFPRTADAFQVPNYQKWYERCSRLLDEIGGLGEQCKLHNWEDLFPVKEKEETAPSSQETAPTSPDLPEAE